jgi:hypothetical protein
MESELAVLTKTDMDKASQVNELTNAAKIRVDKESGAIAYNWEWLKWYEDDDDVGFYKKLIDSLDDMDCPSEYHFIRVGESDDDVEQKGYFWENPFGMCLVRGIAFDD